MCLEVQTFDRYYLQMENILKGNIEKNMLRIICLQ